MAFLDKLKQAKDTAVASALSAAQKTKESYELSKQIREEKKAADIARHNEMLAKAKEKADEIQNSISKNYSDDLDSFFNGKDKRAVFKYTKDFFEKLLLPANSKDKTYITMYPHISNKLSQELVKSFGQNIPYDSILMHLKDTEGQEFLLTYDNLYYRILLEEDKKYPIIGSISTLQISMIMLKKANDKYIFCCDDTEIGEIKINSGKESDFISLNKYLTDLKNSDFEITDMEINNVIKEKIGIFVSNEVENECDEDELILFFTYNSTGGYVVCTNEKIIVADKQSGGNVSNISRFYYDEIISIETKQDATNLGNTTASSSISGMIAEMAVQAVVESAVDSLLKDVCDLEIKGAGIYKKMNGMVKIEADRIVAIFNRFKKENRKAEKEREIARQSPVIIQGSQSQPDVLDQLEKLGKLKEAGIITEDEFNQKKAILLEKL